MLTFQVRYALCGAVLLFSVLALGPKPVLSQACPDGQINNDQVLDLIDGLAARRWLGENVDEPPLAAPPSKQLAAPSRSEESANLVDGVASSDLLGLALNNDLVEFGDDVVTVDLNFFSFLAAVDPVVLHSQKAYEKHETLRRLSGSVTFGGEGDKFDRDGDGEADDPLKAESFGDIVTWEVRWRLYGSRDRRDETNFSRLFEKTEGAFREWFGDGQRLLTQNLTALNDCIDSDTSCFRKDCVRNRFSQDEAWTGSNLGQSAVELNRVLKKAVDAIDNRTIWTLAYGGTERGEEFGPDMQTVALRGSRGNLTWNLEWSETEGLLGTPDPVIWKAGLQQSWLWRPEWVSDQTGVEVSVSGSYEMFDDVPDAMHDTNAKLNAKLELPLGEAVRIPISITWANHEDLLSDEEDVRGHVGFTIDTAKLFKVGKLE